MDSGHVICWKSWHRWSTISLLAYIYLAIATATCRARQAHQRWHAYAEGDAMITN